jgi:tetratricopeptide (TPR) repeat protein
MTIAQRIRKPTAEATAIGGLAGIAFAGGHYRTAVRLYRRAVAIYEAAGDWRHTAEDLGALVESLSALGQLREAEREAQRLVDLAQQTHLAPHAPSLWQGVPGGGLDAAKSRRLEIYTPLP